MNAMLRGIGLALMASSAIAFAQQPAQTTSAPPAANQCAGCHGAQGEGNSAGGFPRIAGQSQNYLSKQLADYAGGRRRNPVMEPIAKALSAADRETVAAYYSKLDTTAQTSTTQTNASVSGRARELAITGDGRRRVQACNNCHGPEGIGEPPLFPYLSGLDAKYLETALKEWRSGARDNDPTKQMPMIAKALAEEDIPALAHYYSTLRAPKPSVAAIKQPPASTTAANIGRAAPAETTAQGSAGSKGVEQGAPTSGGSQGPGGSGDSRNDRSRP
jgi:cytochrome c553